MQITILMELVSTILALLFGGVATSRGLQIFIVKHLGKKPKESKSYSERLSELTSSLTKSTLEVDRILIELITVTKNREESLTKLEADISLLEKREQETKKRIQELQSIPVGIADHFAKLTEEGGRRSARRDYLLFGAGVIVSTIIAIILKLIGWD